MTFCPTLDSDKFNFEGLPIPLDNVQAPSSGDDGKMQVYNLPAYWMFYHPDYQNGTSGYQQACTRPQKIRGPRTGDYKVVFINGMQGNPEKHMMQALATSAVSGGPVHGIYNAGNKKGTTSKFDDLVQCANLKTTSYTKRKNEVAQDRRNTGSDSVAQNNLYQFLLNDSPASATLFHELCNNPKFSNVRICAHSQGNLIACNALNAYIALKGKEAVKEMKVYAIGSPVHSWSEASSIVTRIYFSNDVVAWIDRATPAMIKGACVAATKHAGACEVAKQAYVHHVDDKSQSLSLGIRQAWVKWEEAPGSEVPISQQKTWDPRYALSHSYYLYLQESWNHLVKYFE